MWRIGTRLVLSFGLIGSLAACSSPPPPPTQTLPPAPTVVVTLRPRPTESRAGSLDHIRGEPYNFLQIVHYSDFTCEPCITVARSLLLIQNDHSDKVTLTFRHAPSRHPAALISAEAAEAASAQGKFWEMHDLLFANQAAWATLPEDQLLPKLREFAAVAGVADLDRFDADMVNHIYQARIETAYREAEARGVPSAPGLLFQEEFYSGRIDETSLRGVADLILLQLRHFDRQPPLFIDLEARYIATLHTAKGEVQIELFPRLAPVAVNNFVFLAQRGWYNNITFHLVLDDLVQTGDPSGTGLGTAGYFIADEHDNGLIFDKAGLVAMHNTRGVANSASSQFFITLAPLSEYDYNRQFTIFGEVTQGLDVLRQLTLRDTSNILRFPNPPPGDALQRVVVTEIKPTATP